MRTWMLGRLSTRRLLFLGACVATLTFAACAGSSGGGRGSSGGGEPETGSYTGQAMNGYLVGARVCVDVNLNGRCDDGEARARTQFGTPNGRFVLDTNNAGGSFLVAARTGDTRQYAPGAEEGEGTPIDENFELMAPAGAATVTPLTTLIHAGYVDRINALGEVTGDSRVAAREAARDAVENQLDALGLDGFNTLDEDYLAAGNSNVSNTASAVGRILRAAVADTRNAIAGEGGDPDGFTRAAIIQYAAERVRENLPGIAAAVASGASVDNVVGNNQPTIQAGGGVIEAVQAAQDKLAQAAARLAGTDDGDDDDDDDDDVTGGTGGGGGGR